MPSNYINMSITLRIDIKSLIISNHGSSWIVTLQTIFDDKNDTDSDNDGVDDNDNNYNKSRDLLSALWTLDSNAETPGLNPAIGP